MPRRSITLYGIAAVFVAIVLVLLWLDYERALVVSDVRAYTAGEGLYSKAQKRGINLLFRYVRTGDEENYRAFVEALTVPQGDRDARLALLRSPADYAAARAGFLRGRNDEQDVNRMAHFFTRFRHVSYVAEAIDIWGQGDVEIAHLEQLGAAVHAAVENNATREALNPLLLEVTATDNRLTVLEDQFSTTLGEGARFIVEMTELAILSVSAIMLVLGCVFSLRVIGEVRKAEAALSEADRRKDEFLATLAHELRNPLAPIRTGVQLLKMTRADPAQQERVLEIVDRQTRQLAALVDDLLDISRIASGKLQLQIRRVELNAIVNDAVEASRGNIAAANHQLSIEMGGEPIGIEADPYRLAQVLSNLLNNAARYTPPGGSITLSAVRDGDMLLLTVRDTGVGIPPEMLERVFDMFTQIEHPERDGGLGIGLTLVKSLVELHGGSIVAESEGLNRGSRFRIALPIIAKSLADGRQTGQPAGETVPAAKRRVLVVDDNVDAGETMAELVRALGHDVRHTSEAPQSLDIAEAWRPEVIILDLGMPKMSGYDVAKHIRRQPWSDGVVIVALTGWGQEADKQRTREAGFDHHMVKPADIDVLQGILAAPCPGS